MRFGVFIYDGVEPIDIAAFGVLSMARRIDPRIEPISIGPRAGPVQLVIGLVAHAQYGIAEPPVVDALIVTGGPGWKAQSVDPATLDFIRRTAQVAVVASVCTGGMILAASGILSGLKATTKHEVVEGQEVSPLSLMHAGYPDIDAINARLVDCGQVVTGGGVTLCIDVVLHLLDRFLGAHTASETARILEYTNAWAANRRASPALIFPPQAVDR